MRYPVMIEAGDEATAWGVVVPDLPGCYSAGDTLDEALIAAEEAAAAWIDTALDDGRTIPTPSSVQDAFSKGDFGGCIVGYISINPAMLDHTIERANITLPRRVLFRIDAKAKRADESRSGYIARMSAG